MGCGYSRGSYETPEQETKLLNLFLLFIVFGTTLFLVVVGITPKKINQQSVDTNGQDNVKNTDDPAPMPKEIQKRKNKQP